MRSVTTAVSAALVTVGAAGAVSLAPAASAYDGSINGTYTATVIGDWARTKEVYHQEPVVRSTWTISTSCSTAYDCKGQVVSDQGWTAKIHTHDGANWYLRRDIPNWETCPDGTSFTGEDDIYVYPADPDSGETAPGSSLLVGREHTIGPSGACGTNTAMYIDQPFRLDKIG